MGYRRARLSVVAVALVTLLVPALASAHRERPSYWPDPGPDTSISPPAGGEVPKQRSLRSALKKSAVGETRVVCQGKGGKKSLKKLKRSIRRARKGGGYKVRPSQPKIKVSKRAARKLTRTNKRLAKRCEYRHIQAAVFDSSNNDRVVVMPGRYTEAPSRRQPKNDPRCADLTQLDLSGAETPSLAYHAKCPNDQSLIYIQGREIDGPPPEPPLSRREGIPDEGPCKLCNFQLEGSGLRPVDVLIDAAKRAKTPSGRVLRGVEAPPGEAKKDVVIRADRADGLVVANLTVKGAHEHGLYTEEVDGSLFNRVKFFWNADYGNLTFTSDHNMYKNCDGFGSGDSVVYPGAAPETGEQARRDFYPDAPRINTVVKKCDLRGSALGYSGSMGNAVRITQNHIYANGTGVASDTISASGHPGFPLDSMVVDNNYFYANNLNLYKEDPPVAPTVGVPVGVGFLLAGSNSAKVHDNWFFDNWRRGTMLLAIPDPLVEPEGNVNDGISCINPEITTSCNNRYYDNKMGQIPPDFRWHKAIRTFGNKTTLRTARGTAPNGTDFWWDEFPATNNNCWFDNEGPSGNRESIEADPPIAPVAGLSLPNWLPEDCDSSLGGGDVVKEAVLVDCSTWSRGNTTEDHPACDWFSDPGRPGSVRAAKRERQFAEAAQRWRAAEESADLCQDLNERGGTLDCTEWGNRP